MADYTSIKSIIQSVVKTNGEQEITGANLQMVLLGMINAVDSNNEGDYTLIRQSINTLAQYVDSADNNIRSSIANLLNYVNAQDSDIRSEINSLANSLNSAKFGYNVSVFGLVAGVHTLATAVKNVPPAYRFGGQKITFKTDAGWVTYQNTSLTIGDYEDVENWVLDSGTTVEGDVTITNNPDYEDLTQDEQNKLKFADKEYNAASFTGLGRVYLRKNIVDGVNTLTQAMMSDANTIYHIQYDYVLGEDITVPANCVLEFDGGMLKNGYIVFNNTTISGEGQLFDNVYVHDGHICNNELKASWFGCVGDGVTDDTAALNYFLNFLVDTEPDTRQRRLCYLLDGTDYRITDTIQIASNDKYGVTGAGQATLMAPYTSATYKVRILSENIEKPIFRIYGLRWSFNNIQVGYILHSIVNDTNSIAFIFKMIDDDQAAYQGASMQDVLCQDIDVLNAHVGFECWGNQFQFRDCKCTNVYISYSLNKYVNEPYSGMDTARAILIHNCRLHGSSSRGSFVKINNPTIWGVFVEGCYIDGFVRNFIDGTLLHSVVQDNYLCKISLIDQENTHFIHGDIIHSRVENNSFFAWLKDNPDNITREMLGICSRTIVNSIISGNLFDVGSPSLISTDHCANTIISNNYFSVTKGGDVIDFDGNPRTDITGNKVPAMYLGNYDNRATTQNITITGNVFRFRNADNVIAYYYSNKYYIEQSGNVVYGYDSQGKKVNVETLLYNALNVRNSKTLNNVISSISQAPTLFEIGQMHYPKDIGVPIWWNGSNWVNAFGIVATKTRGTTTERPTLGGYAGNKGIQYFDTTLGKPIWWNGSAWVDATGATV